MSLNTCSATATALLDSNPAPLRGAPFSYPHCVFHLKAPESKRVVMTGDRPTGALHLGHYVGSIQKRLELQKTHPVLILIADTQVLNNDVSKGQCVKANTLSIMRDYLNCGLSPQSCIFVRQSSVSQLFELTNYLSNLVSLSQVMRNPTIRQESKMYNHELNMGFLNYPISQASDILLFNSALVPVGVDQLPILEFTNDLAHKFNQHFETNTLQKISPIISDTPRLIGIDGKHKMSKSLGNAILLSDSLSEVRQKINKMYTDSNHLRVSDPGKIEGNTVFAFLDVFLTDKALLQNLKNQYTRGGLGDMYLKNLLYTEIEKLLCTLQNNSYTDDDLMDILNSGTRIAQECAAHNMELIKSKIFR